MKVSLTDAGKRFNRDWIFRHFTYTFQENSSYAIIGPNGSGKSTLLQVLSGGSLVGKDVPPYIKAARQPLSYAGVNSIGMKRRGFTVEKINHILEIYRVIYGKGLNISQAVEYLEEEFPATDERDEIVQFIRASQRGIIKRFSKTNGDEGIVD